MAQQVTLSSAAMSNLLSLQNTQGLIDRTQNRLSTGKSVNSALDDAMSFFKARNLTNRATDLTVIKSDIENGLNVVKTATDTLEDIEEFLKSAKAAARNARAEKDATVRANYVDQINEILTQISHLAADANYDGINLIRGLDMAKGETVQANYKNAVTGTEYSDLVDMAVANRTNVQVGNQLTALADEAARRDPETEAGLIMADTAGTKLVVTGTKGTAAAAAEVLGNKAVAIAEVTAPAADLDAALKAAQAAGKTTYRDENGVNYVLLKQEGAAGGSEGVATNAAAKWYSVAAETVGGAAVYGGYNQATDTGFDRELRNQVRAEQRISDDQAEAARTLAGTNDKVENLTVVFSEEDKARKLDVTGRDLGQTLAGLFRGSEVIDGGINADDWTLDSGAVDIDAIDQFITLIDNAAKQVRTVASELGNFSTIMSLRGEWTDGMVNTLQGGSADLVNADMNEESANMLALQTRQQLGVIALSIAQQSEQAVLRLF